MNNEQQIPSHSASSPSVDDLARVFNTAMISTRVESVRDFSAELFSLVESPSYRSILTAVKLLARSEGLSEREASEKLIQTFRRLDRLWSDYLLQEGADRLKPSGL